MAIKNKKRNKFVVPQEYNQSTIFAQGGNLYGIGDYLSAPGMMQGQLLVSGGPDLSKITQQGVGKLNAAGAVKSPTTPQTPGLGTYLGAAQGAMQLGSQAINNLDTSGIGSEVVGTDEMSRNDILNTNVNVDSRQTNTGGQALSGAMTGAQAGMCVCAGTLLYLQDGSQIPVEQLSYGDAVLGWKNNLATIQRIEYFHEPTKKECVELITEKGYSIKCSIDHPILWSKSGLVKRKPGYRALGLRNKRFEFKSAGDIKVAEQVGIIREVPYFGEYKLENARLVGMLIGDGYYGKSKSVTFATADVELRDFVIKYGATEELDSNDKFFRCRIINIIPLLKRIGIRGQSKELKRLPLNFDRMDKESICELIGGLFDTDGCVSVDGTRVRIQFAQSNIELLKQLQNMLVKIGVISNISKVNSPRLKVFPNGKQYERREQFLLDISDKLSVVNFAKNVKLLINRKQSKLDLALKYDITSKYSNEYGVLFDRVKSVNTIGEQLVYNIAVSDSHTYIANNIVTHNSFGPLGAAIGGGVGLIGGGLSSIFGNKAKEKKAEFAEQKWIGNLEAKNRQFQGQDLRTSMANFSAMGGDLFAYGGQMPSQLTSFESGGSHQSNPNGGILQGTGANGQPNLVEEGETKHEDYIFSDRLKVNPQISKDFKLPKGLKGKTFADASKILNKEAKERPNDPISAKAVKANLAKLTAAQETIKAIKEAKENPQQQMQPDANMLAQGYASGGYIDQSHFTQTIPTGYQVYANGGNMFDGVSQADNYLNFVSKGNYIPQPEVVDKASLIYPKNVMYPSVFSENKTQANNVKATTKQVDNEQPFLDKLKGINTEGFDRYAPVAANMALGISDIFSKPEQVNLPRYNPEMITSRMDYKPIDTEWMANKMKGQAAGTREALLNTSGGNRAIAMAGLMGADKQFNEALGESYLKAGDINYNRKLQADQFNAGIEQQNVATRNQAAQINNQLQMQEMDMNSRNRAAKRNAARQAIIQAATDLGGIGRENYFSKTAGNVYGYTGQGEYIKK